MPSTYTLNNGIELIGTGEQSGTWGDTTNTNLELLDVALDGQVTITAASAGSSGSPNSLPITDGSASDGRNRLVNITSGSDLGSTVYYQLTPNDAEKIIYIRNSLNSRDLIVFQGTYNSSNDYLIPNGTTAIIFFNGAGAGAVAANVFNNAHFDALNVVGQAKITTGSGNTYPTASTSADELVVSNLTASAPSGITIFSDNASSGNIFFGDEDDADNGRIVYDHSTATGNPSMAFSTSATEAMRIDSSQRVLINGAASTQIRTRQAVLQSNGTSSDAGASFTRWSASGGGPYLTFAKSRTGTVNGGFTILQDGDTVGTIDFAADDGTDLTTPAAAISAFVDGTPGANDMPGRLVFSTTADGANGATERMRITQAGNVEINFSDSDVNGKLNVNGDVGVRNFLATSNPTGGAFSFTDPDSSTILGILRVGDDDGSSSSVADLQIISYGSADDDGGGNIRFINSRYSKETGLIKSSRQSTNTGYMDFYTENGSGLQKAMRINSSQRVLIGGDTDFAVAGREKLLVEHTDGGGISMRRLDSSITTNDTLGRLNFYGSDGASVGNDGIGAAIVAKAAGTFAANDFPTNLGFFTNVDNAENLVENLTIRYDGHVGINDTTPSTILSVKDDNTIVQIAANGGTAQSYFIVNANRGSATQHLAEIIGQWNGTSVGRIVIAAGDDTTNKDDGEITFYTAPSGTMTRRMVIRNNGNIGIGNDVGIDPVSPSSFGTALEIGDNDGGSLVLTDTNTTTNKKSFFMSSKGTKFNLGTMNDDGSGDAGILFLDHTTQHVGIGTDDPDTLFAVYDDTTWDTATFKSNTGTGAGFTMQATSTGVEWSLIAQGTAGGADDNNLGFHLTNAGTSGQSAGYKFAMNASGDLKIFDGNLNMATAGTGIDFSATALNGSSELLDDYEEGSWSPEIQYQNATDDGNATNTTQTGTYTKVGNLIFVEFRLIWSLTGTPATDNILVDNLPYSISSTNSNTYSINGIARAVNTSNDTLYYLNRNVAGTDSIIIVNNNGVGNQGAIIGANSTNELRGSFTYLGNT